MSTSTITATAPLDVDEENRLVALAQDGDKPATARLVEAHVRYLRSEAAKYAAAEPLLTTDDLLSAALEAFLGAIRSFDPTRGARLLTHARPAVAEAMDNEKATVGRAISVPPRTLRKYRRALREAETLDAARALAEDRDGMTRETFDAVHFAMTGGVPLDSPVPGGGTPITNGAALNGGEGDSWGGSPNGPAALLSTDHPLLGSRGQSPEGTALARNLAAQALAALDPKAREVVALAYLTGEDLSDAQIAVRVGVSRPTVTRLRNAALASMRVALDV